MCGIVSVHNSGLIELASDEEATGHNEADIWFDASETIQTAPDMLDLHNQDSELIDKDGTKAPESC